MEYVYHKRDPKGALLFLQDLHTPGPPESAGGLTDGIRFFGVLRSEEGRFL
jgi:hypothetical protein